MSARPHLPHLEAGANIPARVRALPAIHVNWTAPHFAGRARDGASRSRGPYALPDFELLTTVFSALAWRRLYGSAVSLYTDDAGLRFYEQEGVAELYARVDTALLREIDPRAFAPQLHFAAAKLFAVAAQRAPFVLLDTDLVLRRRVPGLARHDFVCAHWERPTPEVYGTRATLPNPNRVPLPRDAWTGRACNMAFAYFGDERHRQRFPERALAFLRDNDAPAPKGLHPAARMIFAEQRLCAVEAERLGLRVGAVYALCWDGTAGRFDGGARGAASARERIFNSASDGRGWFDPRGKQVFHHTWFLKGFSLGEPARRRAWCLGLLAELLEAFPEQEERLARMRTLRPLWRARRESA